MQIWGYGAKPSTAKIWDFAHLSPVFLVSLYAAGRISKHRSNPGALQSTGITSTSKPPQWSI
jgi:hypothetical protein